MNPPGGSTTEFLIQTEENHGVVGLINLFGIRVAKLDFKLDDRAVVAGKI